MKPVLEFKTEIIQMCGPLEEAVFPDILSGQNIQNKTVFELEETDEIYEGYGRLNNAYPYRPYNSYDRTTCGRRIKTAVLENAYLKAVFLPKLGGRLWRLIDKNTGCNLLYTNDVIRPSNLAVRNAWFSGGVEWNMGVIGHTPLTMEPLFTAVLEDAHSNPVLRMYEYERIRRAVYQMDFWLEEDGRFLNCRMRVVNNTPEVIPMYWWSNIAVPEYEGGRILVPAREAFTSDRFRVYKTAIPVVDGIDISCYNQIRDQVDYFFHIPKEEQKYIANLNSDGYGLLHLSTSRLQSRKLFVWGHNEGADRWQEFLTKKAGRYIEIQAGLGKTQYGCIPMAPHTAWEWLELYGPVSASASVTCGPFEKAVGRMGTIVSEIFARQRPEERLKETDKISKSAGKVVQKGSGYGELENMCRGMRNEGPVAENLDFTSDDKRQREWVEFLQTGSLNCPPPNARPSDFTRDDFWFERLKEFTEEKGGGNWYAHYQLGLQYYCRGEKEPALKEFSASEQLKANSFAEHGMAVCMAEAGRGREAVQFVLLAVLKRLKDLSAVKECFRLLISLRACEEALSLYERLSPKLREESRIYLCYIEALAGTGRYEEAYALLTKDGGPEIADFREGDQSVELLWQRVCEGRGRKEKLPGRLNFSAMV